MKETKVSWDEFRSQGLLWLVNRVVFHPRGLALGIDPEFPGTFFLYGEGEPWHYDLEPGQEDELFHAVEALFRRAMP